MITKVEGIVNFKAPVGKFDKQGNPLYYDVSFFCNENKTIHSNVKSTLNCRHCVAEEDKAEYEAKKRLEWFINGYEQHNLGNNFKNISTERICELYNVELKYFRPWI